MSGISILIDVVIEETPKHFSTILDHLLRMKILPPTVSIATTLLTVAVACRRAQGPYSFFLASTRSRKHRPCGMPGSMHVHRWQRRPTRSNHAQAKPGKARGLQQGARQKGSDPGACKDLLILFGLPLGCLAGPAWQLSISAAW